MSEIKRSDFVNTAIADVANQVDVNNDGVVGDAADQAAIQSDAENFAAHADANNDGMLSADEINAEARRGSYQANYAANLTASGTALQGAFQARSVADVALEAEEGVGTIENDVWHWDRSEYGKRPRGQVQAECLDIQVENNAADNTRRVETNYNFNGRITGETLYNDFAADNRINTIFEQQHMQAFESVELPATIVDSQGNQHVIELGNEEALIRLLCDEYAHAFEEAGVRGDTVYTAVDATVVLERGPHGECELHVDVHNLEIEEVGEIEGDPPITPGIEAPQYSPFGGEDWEQWTPQTEQTARTYLIGGRELHNAAREEFGDQGYTIMVQGFTPQHLIGLTYNPLNERQADTAAIINLGQQDGRPVLRVLREDPSTEDGYSVEVIRDPEFIKEILSELGGQGFPNTSVGRQNANNDMRGLSVFSAMRSADTSITRDWLMERTDQLVDQGYSMEKIQAIQAHEIQQRREMQQVQAAFADL